MSFLQTHQLDIMLFMSGICFILAFMTVIIKYIPKKKKSILLLLEISSMLMLIFEREAYIHRGDMSNTSYLMVRYANAIVFFMILFIPHLITLYLEDLYKTEGELTYTPFSLKVCKALFYAGTALLIASQFTGLYYTFNEQNLYVRSPWFPISYIAPGLTVLLQEHTLIKYRKILKRSVVWVLVLIISLPTIASVAQIFLYGVSLTSMAVVMVVIAFYIFIILTLTRTIREGREHEISIYKESKEKQRAMFEETVEALANAVDAKDSYTRGHSSRVADLSRRIGKMAGYSEEKCDELYFAALLHDIGKIGISDAIINKKGWLTDEEFEKVKEHSILGYQILSSIKTSPSLSVGAHYHHERYNGTGYPEGLKGTDIPEYARIIAVADAYDAMSSTRSYRDKLPAENIRKELIRGIGTQFDPNFAQMMLMVMDEAAEQN